MEENLSPDFHHALIRKIEDAIHIIHNLSPYMKQLSQKKELIDGQEVMQLLRISKRTLQNLRDKKIIGYYQLSGKYFYNYDEMVALMKKSYQPPVDRDNFYLKALLPLLLVITS